MTAQDLIDQALSKLGIIGSGNISGHASAADSALGLSTLNLLLDSFNVDLGLSDSKARATYPFPSNSIGASIGPGGQINTPVRPTRIEGAFVLDQSNTRISELPIYTDSVLFSERYPFQLNTQQRNPYPYAIIYAATFDAGLGSVSWAPAISGTGYSLELYFPLLYGSYATLADPVYLAPGHAEAVIYNLAISLADSFGTAPSEVVVAKAAYLLDRIRSMNAANHQPRLTMDPGALVNSSYRGGIYNIYTDGNSF